MKNNSMRNTFCPGPGAVIPEWSEGQTEFFGRGDNHYTSVKKKTFNLVPTYYILIPLIIDASQSYATLGEIVDSMKAVFGEWNENSSI